MSFTFSLIGIFLSFTFLLIYIFLFFSKIINKPDRTIISQVQKYSQETLQEDDAAVQIILKDDKLSPNPIFNRILQKLDIAQKLRLVLTQAGMKVKVGDIFIQILLFSTLGIFIGLITKNIVIKFILILLLGSYPLINVYTKRSNRYKAFVREFPDAIDMMVSTLKAGHAFTQAIQLVGSEAPDPVGIEFKKTFEEHNLGLDLREALFNFTERVSCMDLKLFVTAVLLQKETGGNLTEILENISHTIRERFKLLGQLKIYTAQGRMSGLIIGSLPIVFVLIMSLLNPDYLKPLYGDKIGHYLIAIAFILQIIGFIWIKKVLKIKLT